ncbi:hypothetical protein ABGB12_00845 [Actinocorallia sp. B10E7]
MESPSSAPSQTPSPSTPPEDADTGDETDDDVDGNTGDEPTETPTAAPELHVVLSIPESAVLPGDKVKATAHVYAAGAVAKAAKLKVTASGGVKVAPTCTLASDTCNLGDVTAQGDFVPVELSVPATAAPGSLRVTAAVSARSAAPKTVVQLLTIAKKGTATPSASAPGTSTPTASPVPSATPAPQASAPPGPAATPYSVLPSTAPQTALPGDSPPDNNSAQLPLVVAGPSSASQPLSASQNVAAIRPGGTDDMDRLARVQAIWLSMLLTLFAALFIQLKRPVRGAHRRLTRGRFAR